MCSDEKRMCGVKGFVKGNNHFIKLSILGRCCSIPCASNFSIFAVRSDNFLLDLPIRKLLAVRRAEDYAADFLAAQAYRTHSSFA